MGKRTVFLAGLLALMVAAGWAMTSPTWAQPPGGCGDDAVLVDDDCADGDIEPHPVIPEPTTLGLIGLGLTALGLGYRSRKRS
jgi:hypothetical protein